MSPFDYTRVSIAAVAAATLLGSAPAFAASDVSIELNRLEQNEGACRVSLVVANPGDKALDSLKLDLVFFGKDGVITRRLAVEAGPVRASKTSVKLFDVGDAKCGDIGKVLLNDVTACGGAQDCLPLVSTSSRAKDVEFSK